MKFSGNTTINRCCTCLCFSRFVFGVNFFPFLEEKTHWFNIYVNIYTSPFNIFKWNFPKYQRVPLKCRVILWVWTTTQTLENLQTQSMPNIVNKWKFKPLRTFLKFVCDSTTSTTKKITLGTCVFCGQTQISRYFCRVSSYVSVNVCAVGVYF